MCVSWLSVLYKFIDLSAVIDVERGSLGLECNRESPGLNLPFVTISKFEHFRSIHDASVHSAV